MPTIEIVPSSEYETLFERGTTVDPELLELFRKQSIGNILRITPDEGDSERKTKRYYNGIARLVGYELDWRSQNGYMVARIVANQAQTVDDGDKPKRGRPRGS